MPSRRSSSAFVRVLLHVLLSLLILFPVLSAQKVSAGQLTATWVDNSGGQAGFAVERRRDTDATFLAIADVPPGNTSFVDPAISDGIRYCYRVKAFDALGESPYSAEACAATAVTSSYTVAVSKTGTGTGTVSSSPAGIICGTDCSEAYVSGSLVTLTATAAQGSKFVGWSGGCAGTSTCMVIGNAATTVTATFNIQITGRMKNNPNRGPKNR
jgi:hypothetical protein